MNGNAIDESGYLLTGVEYNDVSGKYTYRGVEIVEENNKPGLKQNIYIEGAGTGRTVNLNGSRVGGILNYPCKKIDGVKYYQSNSGTTIRIRNNELAEQYDVKDVTDNKMGIEYYKSAYEFKEKFKTGGTLSGLKDLEAGDSVDKDGKSYRNKSDNPYTNYKIFEGLLDSNPSTYIEDSNSNFNAHKMQVIKNSIESNLIAAIANYNKVSDADVNFAMPKLKEDEWEELTQNISVITFLQGLNIGGKIYNGYTIVPNNHNEEYISEDSIYILNNGEYHKVTDSDLLENNNDAIGILNTDFEIKGSTIEDSNKNSTTFYYAAKDEVACYNSIINVNSQKTAPTNVYEYFKDVGSGTPKYHLAQVYYTALGRERWGMYRVTNRDEYITELKAGKDGEEIILTN